jgi:hypothetical protein
MRKQTLRGLTYASQSETNPPPNRTPIWGFVQGFIFGMAALSPAIAILIVFG